MELLGVGAGVVFFLAIMVIAIGGLIFWVVALIECIRYPEHVYRAAGSEKVMWVLVVALAGWIGGLVYWFAIRQRLQEVEASGAAAAYAGQAAAYAPVPPGWYKDPQADGRMRYWDGRSWTGHVT